MSAMRPTSFPIVAIAASAGGLEAVSELLAAAAPHSGMAYIVVQHLDPTHESLLSEILAKKTTMEVVPAAEGLTVEPDHVYVIPPNVTLTLEDNVLHLTPRERGPARHKPADALLKSLAESRGDAAISVVLSGGDSDGSLGTQQIKHSGGITFAQEPSSARFPSMPRSAIETGCVDFVLHPRQIAGELARLGAHPYLRVVSEPADSSGEMPEAATAAEEERLRRIFRRLRSAHGVDFTHYKRSTLRRRLARRMALQKIDGPADYLALIETDPAEATALYQDFLIRVTGFFRDPESFEGLAQRVFPSLCEGRSPKEPIRIWVPGCATGEETYSIAMALVEYLGERLSPESIQIFGTDVSEAAIEKARAGTYLDTIAQEVSAERLARFFVKADDHYRIAKSIRDLCIFARQDVIRDPPFSRLDLVSCRNLLIYLDATVQRRVMQVFHYSLRPNGFLMLSPSESIGQATELFELTDKRHRIYARKAGLAGSAPDLTARAMMPYARPHEAAGEEASVALEAESVQREADRLLLARFAPASLLVDEELNILQVRGETGPYLEFASGAPSLNLHRVARPELLVEIIPTVQEVRESGSEARREGLSIDQSRNVSIEVIPLKRLSTERCYLILFDDGSRPPSGRRAQAAPTAALPESEKDRRLGQLERENAALRAYQQATMEEHEAVKEELKSAHEEVLSANEEFQSTNEELETSQEELQSANEELTTTNDELRNRNRELAVVNAELDSARGVAERAQAAAEAAGISSEQARRYADAIVESVREPLLVLAADLRILRANQAYYRDFGERAELTEGRLIYEIGSGQWNGAALRERLDAVLTRGEPTSDCEITVEVPSRGRRVMSLSARRIPGDRERSELILLAFEDITERRTRSESLREGARRKDEFLAMLAHELRNPLAPITHALHLLRDRYTDPTSVKLYDMMGRQTQRLVRLVDELLDVARISRGLIAVKRDPVDLIVVVREAVEASRPRIEQGHHALSLTLPEEPVWLNGDSVRLEQVVCNLLENAAKYTPPGGQITLILRRQEANEVVLIVRDTGIGLDPATVDAIFELFMQVDRSLSRSDGGLGLGLAVVRRIVELHAGRIEARSAGLGAGSEFIVRLPLIPSSAKVQPAVHTDASASVVTPRRVLVVDDNADAAESMALVARSWGHEVATARDGTEALAVAKSFRPDTALVDIGLPGMDGYELAHRLRRQLNGQQLQLVAMTGYGRSEDREAADAAGFDIHMVKPADLEQLRRVLASDPTDSET